MRHLSPIPPRTASNSAGVDIPNGVGSGACRVRVCARSLLPTAVELQHATTRRGERRTCACTDNVDRKAVREYMAGWLFFRIEQLGCELGDMAEAGRRAAGEARAPCENMGDDLGMEDTLTSLEG